MAFYGILDKHAPIKMKMLTHNSNSFITKYLRRPVMHTSNFKNCFNKHYIYENWCNDKTQRNQGS